MTAIVNIFQRAFVITLVTGLCFGSSLVMSQSASDATVSATNFGTSLEALRTKLNLPGVAGVVMQSGQIVAGGTAGLRRLGATDKIQNDDRFGIGSRTKHMTGLMIGRLVDEGKLSFDTKVGEALPDIPMRDEYRNVTIAQLLAFTGAIATYERIGPKITPQLFDTSGTEAERETRFVKHLLQEMPVGVAGKESHYSNAS